MCERIEVSIIIPVYNEEKQISHCLDSIQCQEYKNYEVIIVDDGSIDKTGEICDSYAKKDSRFKVIHEANGGVSVARNKGIDVVMILLSQILLIIMLKCKVKVMQM